MKSNSAGPDLVADVAPQRGDRRLAALDQLGDDGRIGLDRSRGAARPAAAPAPVVRERRDEVAAVEDGLPARRGSADRPRPISSRQAGPARRRCRACWVTSTNSRPPASGIGAGVGQLPHRQPERLHGVGHHLLVPDGDVDVVARRRRLPGREQRGDRPALDDLEARRRPGTTRCPAAGRSAPRSAGRARRAARPARRSAPAALRRVDRSSACRPGRRDAMLAATVRDDLAVAYLNGPGSPGRIPAPRRGRGRPRSRRPSGCR